MVLVLIGTVSALWLDGAAAACLLAGYYIVFRVSRKTSKIPLLIIWTCYIDQETRRLIFQLQYLQCVIVDYRLIAYSYYYYFFWIYVYYLQTTTRLTFYNVLLLLLRMIHHRQLALIKI